MEHPLPKGTVIRAYTSIGRSARTGSPLHGFITGAILSVREWVSPAGRKDYFYTVERKGKPIEVPHIAVHGTSLA